MRFTSLIVELIRARPRLVLWLAVLGRALLWLVVPLIFYRSPPGDLATLLAVGHEYQVGTDLGPPLAFWLADGAFRVAGHHMIGVYLLSQLCFAATCAVLYELARRIVGAQHAVLAVLLTMTIPAFGAPGAEFGPQVLASPLWALILLDSWRVIGERRRSAWFALSIEAGLLLLTTSSAPWLLLLVVVFALATARGRRALAPVEAAFAALVVAILGLPYAVWLLRAGLLTFPASATVYPAAATANAAATAFAGLLVGFGLALVSLLFLVALDLAVVQRLLFRRVEDVPMVSRAPVDPLARQFVYFFAVAPALVGILIALAGGARDVAGGIGVTLTLSGLAVVVAAGDLIALRRQRILRAVWAAMIAMPALAVVAITLIQPWFSEREVATNLPANQMSRFFADNFQRRTNRPLPAVAGDPGLAALIALGPARPQPLLSPPLEHGPWLTAAQFDAVGGVVVWRAADTAGSPPKDIAVLFPGLVPEVPRSFDRLVNGSQPPLRIGWAIVRPKSP